MLNGVKAGVAYLRKPALVVAFFSVVVWVASESPPGLKAMTGFETDSERGEKVVPCDQVIFPVAKLSTLMLDHEIKQISMADVYPNLRSCYLGKQCIVRCGPSYDFVALVTAFLNKVPVIAVVAQVGMAYLGAEQVMTGVAIPPDPWNVPSTWCDGEWSKTRNFLSVEAEAALCPDYRKWGEYKDDLTDTRWWCLWLCRTSKA